jgi:hypothetical protein
MQPANRFEPVCPVMGAMKYGADQHGLLGSLWNGVASDGPKKKALHF